MPKQDSIKKTLVIGSGPIVIGQAAEFDYAGTQACRALSEEGIQVVLVNSNPATIMTDAAMADRVYIEPLTVPVLKRIIELERPDSLLATLGGQTGLNLASELNECGFLEEMGVTVLGTDAEAIFKAEDREAFKQAMEEIGVPCIESVIARDVETAVAFAGETGYPVIVRPAYTLGGTGGGMAYDVAELREICESGLEASRVHQCLIEKGIAGWKEIEFEVIRDHTGKKLSICDMENIDPVGVHTGDSIVIAPCQSLTKDELSMLREAALRIIDALGIEGGCNVQFALKPGSMDYYIIEVNPRLSRSSALASKATAYPIARVASKIAVGYALDEITFGQTGSRVCAAFEPNVTYAVLKIPRWPFDKFVAADKRLGTKMKATGEVMAIGQTFEEAFLKALRSLELGLDSLRDGVMKYWTDEELLCYIKRQEDKRIFAVSEALGRGMGVEALYALTKIDKWFLERLEALVKFEDDIILTGLNDEKLARAKRMGFADRALGRMCEMDELDVRAWRKRLGIVPSFVKVVTSAEGPIGEYYYSTYARSPEPMKLLKNNVAVLGAGPIRIGQGIEFDYCSVRAVWALKKSGKSTVIINNNPETVSTDFDTADRLYFEPLTPEDVWNVLELEQPEGVVVQFGGQTAIKLAKPVRDMGYDILGTSLENIDAAEDRERFDALVESLHIARPMGATVFTEDEAVAAADKLGYPVLVRPSYVLGGQGMKIAYDEAHIREYMRIINMTVQEHPVLIDKYIRGREIEVDAICDGRDIIIPGIMEHIERAGVHSGDSISLYPAANISAGIRCKIVEYTEQIARKLSVRGLINIQYIARDEQLYVIEVNPRSSRTVPYISKVTGVPVIDLAVGAMLGKPVASMGYDRLVPDKPTVAVKVPVFSLEKLPDVEVSLGPEMKSTGEVLGLAGNIDDALLKGLVASGISLSGVKRSVLISVADNDKQELVPIASDLDRMGFDIYATAGTASVLNKNYVAASVVTKDEGKDQAIELINQGKIGLIINTPTDGSERVRFGFKLRRKAVEHRLPCMTSLDTARALVNSILAGKDDAAIEPLCLQDLEV